MTVGFKWVVNPLCLYMSGQFLHIKKPVIPTATPPPRVCPSATFVCLPSASFESQGFTKEAFFSAENISAVEPRQEQAVRLG